VQKWDETKWQIELSISSFGFLDKLTASPDGLVLAAGGGSPPGLWRKSAGAWTFDEFASSPQAFWAQSANNALSFHQNTAFRFNGTSWQSITAPTNFFATSVDGSGADFAIGVGYGQNTSIGRAVRWNGTAWSDMTWPTGTGGPINVKVVSSSLAYAITNTNVLLKYDGTSWSTITGPTPTPSELPFQTVTATSASDVYLLTRNGALFHSDGSTWSRIATFTATPDVFPNYAGMSISPQGFGVIVGYNGRIFTGANGATGRPGSIRRE
jgi:hypothetical protein